MRKIDTIIMHCSDSEWGNKRIIDRWHRQRGFRCIGYHYVILNGVLWKTTGYYPELDGRVEKGRPIARQGAHAKRGGHNVGSIGICLIGKTDFTVAQFKSARDLVWEIKNDYRDMRIIGHSEVDDNKTCPVFDMDTFRDYLNA